MPQIYFYYESIFNIIRVLNSCICQKTAPPVFEKKRLSLSLLCLSKLSLKVENGSCCKHQAPPLLRRAGAPGLISFLQLKAFEILTTMIRHNQVKILLNPRTTEPVTKLLRTRKMRFPRLKLRSKFLKFFLFLMVMF